MLKDSKAGQQFGICVDSQAAVSSLENLVTISRFVCDYRIALDRLGGSNDLTLVRIPDHPEIYGNKKVDQIARLWRTESL